MQVKLDQLAAYRRSDKPRGIVSVCSAHPLVLRAALRNGRRTGTTVLIEATCNQVNHLGGYTGMTPEDFADLVFDLADQEGCPRDQIVIGGDHLGPNPWRSRPAAEAMAEAEAMVAAYVAAGFRKIHLDASMGCAGEPLALDDATTAERACRLARVAEETARAAGNGMPVYIIGTEVPPPGGADHALTDVPPTDPDAARKTIAIHRKTFSKAGLDEAFSRVIGLVVQPGVEFGNQNVVRYDRQRAQPLVNILDDEPNLVFEAHSTDYQGIEPLRELVEDGFGILKVGPELTFVLRETLYALDLIASDLDPAYGERSLKAAMDTMMLADPGFWKGHYNGDPATIRMLRHYSLSDRIRYYWPKDEAAGAVDHLLDTLRGKSVPLPLIWQHLPDGSQFAGKPLQPEDVLIWRVTKALDAYQAACGTGGTAAATKDATHVA
ncbi:D-tagatose-1,6-bisphosphate aldolase subunit KbaZ [Hartmannibacter diazotrophicus]|uniref:D-tagatose-1,6-bisphosphate aldolase subunit KbaZ n=2 Tax=Hartmannibacter diazotrophicus TaxID=1482074 RepID=A0A2C9D1X6_9HYPH|nr:D-tagatose-1,6-bisphosphate aldolase subunit KbaZ [Hartmannibacter diazotrophicus]